MGRSDEPGCNDDVWHWGARGESRLHWVEMEEAHMGKMIHLFPPLSLVLTKSGRLLGM